MSDGSLLSFLQLIWHAEEEKKQQCIFKGKDPQVGNASRGHELWQEEQCSIPLGVWGPSGRCLFLPVQPEQPKPSRSFLWPAWS